MLLSAHLPYKKQGGKGNEDSKKMDFVHAFTAA
ncbi:hypothetical protein PTHTG4_19260 [Parageobacillus thermoglucosidasius]|nr:hypothetical protein PTHTG4_19260 [Parageobacillus thermoglucosidasius]